MSISDILTLQAKKKQLEDLLRNSLSNNNWIEINKNVEEWKLNIKKYDDMLENNELTPRQKANIEIQIKSCTNTLQQKESQLLNTLLHSIPKEEVQKEIEEIKVKEREYIDILLNDAKERYKQELQNKMDQI
jgi:hypothetical protein